MGFDGIGILFRDTKTDNLFTISDTFDEADLRVIKEYEEKLKRGELLSEEEKIIDFERQFREKAMHIYPNTLGVTGQVFQSGKYVVNNAVSQMTNFLPSVDNLSSNVKDVYNMFIVPVFGHRLDEDNDELLPQLPDSGEEHDDKG
jgi:hypothetical protein